MCWPETLQHLPNTELNKFQRWKNLTFATGMRESLGKEVYVSDSCFAISDSD